MPTIKEVAKRAGVSHGTVSNVINGAKNVNSDIVRRVEIAIKELGYQPDAKARSLRISKTNMIGVILPNISDTTLNAIYTGIENILRPAGYTIALFLSNDLPQIEKDALNKLLQQRAEVVITVSCIPGETELYDNLIHSGVHVVFVSRKPDDMYRRCFVGMDEEEIFYQAVKAELAANEAPLALLAGNQSFSPEYAATKGFTRAYEEENLPFLSSMIRFIDSGKEGAFRTAVWWLQSANVPKVIFTTCSEFAKGADAAVKIFQHKQIPKTKIISLDCESWTQNASPSQSIKLLQNYLLLGETAAQTSLSLISDKASVSQNNIILQKTTPPVPCDCVSEAPTPLLSFGKPLRLLLLDGAASYASRLMSQKFTSQFGIDVEIDVASYEEILFYGHRQHRALNDSYDILQVNVSWFQNLANEKSICSLEHYLDPNSLDCPQDVLQSYCFINGKLWSVPYMLDSQLLFYRKDLFESLSCQRSFYEKYKAELRVPQTWEEYNRVAKFFTQESTPTSPVRYGTTLGGNSFYSVYGLVPRIWELGSDLCNHQNDFCMEEKGIKLALQEYLECFRYADPNAKNWRWKEQTVAFSNGEAAMMTLYQAHFMDHLNRENTFVDGKIGVAPLPGGVSIRGGWSLSIDDSSCNKEMAAHYLKWMCCPENIIPYNILGGSMPGNSALGSLEIGKTYPWFFTAYETLGKSRMMLPENARLNQWEFEQIFGAILNQGICQNGSAEEIAKEFLQKIKK